GRLQRGSRRGADRRWYPPSVLRPPRRARLPQALALLIPQALALLTLLAGSFAFGSGCAAQPTRLRYLSSVATQASWSFVIDDRARAAELLVDGRTRLHDCDRAGRTLRCELRGLFPGGHTVEVRLPGAVLERSVVIGKPWPVRPALVRVRSADEAGAAAAAGADGVIADGALDPAELGEIADAAHARGARFLVT